MPPEIISFIFSKIPYSSSRDERTEFSRLCLVNRSFLPLARQRLYSALHLHICADPAALGGVHARYESLLRNSSLLHSILSSKRHLAQLVQELDMSFVDPPPLPDDLVQVIEVIGALPNLKKLVFKGERKNWWKAWEGKGKKKDLTDLRTILIQAHHLEVLAIPQVSFDSINTYHLLNSLKQVKRLKGELRAPPGNSTPLLDLGFTHLDASAHGSPRDLDFYITPCLLPLRYLHLHFDGNVPLIPLVSLSNLNHLVTTIEPDLRTSNHFSSDSFLSTLESCQNLPKLSSLTLNITNMNTYVAIMLVQQLVKAGLPRTIETFAVGTQASWYFPRGRTFLGSARERYPRLMTIGLGGALMGGMENDADRNRAMFQTNDVVGVYGIQVNWMEQMEWEG